MSSLKFTTDGNPFPEKTSKVKVPWGDYRKLPREISDRAWYTCKRGNKTHCINSNFVRAFAKAQGRTIRYVQTYKGMVHWSEIISGHWAKFVAPLTLDYAKTIDLFDHSAANFKPPKKSPFGPVRFVGFAVERRDPPEVIKIRKTTMNARIKNGELVPGSKFRELQAAYVEAQI